MARGEREVKVTVLGDSKGAERALKNVADATDRVGPSTRTANNALDSLTSSLTDRLGPASGQAKSFLDGVGHSAMESGGLMKTALVGGAAIGGAALAKFAADGISEFVNLAAEVRNFQRASGASAEESSRFVAVLDDLGISSEQGASAIFKLGKTASTNAEALEKNGIEIARNRDGTVNLTETLLNAADAYQATSDPAKRAEIAFAAFGKQGQALIPILEQGRSGLESFFESAEEGRQIMSQEDLDKARKFELAMDDLQDTLRGLKLEAGEALLPLAITAAESLTTVLKLGSSLKAIGGDKVFEALGAQISPLGSTINIVTGLLGDKKKKLDETKLATDSYADATGQSAAASMAAAQQEQAHAAALEQVLNASIAAVSGEIAYQGAVNTLRDGIADLDNKQRSLNDAVREHGPASEEAERASRTLRDAHLNIENAALRAAGAAVKLAEDQAMAAGTALTAQEKHEIFRSKLVELGNQADGPTRDAILRLAQQIHDVPAAKTIAIDADTNDAHRKIEELKRSISGLAVLAAGGAGVQVSATPRQHGGPVRAGRAYIVGERQPELFIPDADGHIVPRVPDGGGGGATTTNITVTAQSEVSPLHLAREIAWAMN